MAKSGPYKVTVRRGGQKLFDDVHNGMPEEYCQGCIHKDSVYGSFKKQDLWTYELILKPEYEHMKIETLVFFRQQFE